MRITYSWDHPARSRTPFQKYHARTRDQILDQLIKWQNRIGEASTLGTDLDREIWSTATEPNDLWGRAQRHRNQLNTMMSVMAGAIDKLRSGGDLTERQAENVVNIAEIMNTLMGTPQWEWHQLGSQPRPQGLFIE